MAGSITYKHCDDLFGNVWIKNERTQKKCMISRLHNFKTEKSNRAYNRIFNRDLPSGEEMQQEKVVCEMCSKELQRHSMRTHYREVHGVMRRTRQLERTPWDFLSAIPVASSHSILWQRPHCVGC